MSQDITEGVAPNTAFAVAMREAEARAAAEQLGETIDEQPRDEHGKFVAATDNEAIAAEAPTEPEPVAETLEAEPTAADVLLAGKYRSVEELERGYLEAQAFAARQGNELGELRNAFEQQFAQINERLDTPQPVQRQITPDLIEQNPSYATQVAYEQNDPQTLAVAFEQWKLEDPGSAASWLAEKRIAENAQRLEAQFEERYKQLEQRVAPIQAQNEQTILAEGVRSLPEDVRAFLQDGEAVQQLANEFPTLGQTIATGTASERINAIQALHGIHRGRTADTLTTAATDVARTVAQEAQAVRDEAYVAGSTTSEAETMTWEQQEQAKAVQAFTSKASLWDEALVRPGK